MTDQTEQVEATDRLDLPEADAAGPGELAEIRRRHRHGPSHRPPRHAHHTIQERGLREEVFDVTIKKEGVEAAPERHSMNFNPGEVIEAELIIPDGPCGTTGVRVVSGDGPVWPVTKGAWFRGNNERIKRAVRKWPTSGRFDLEGYNTDKFDHTFSVRFAVREPRREQPFTTETEPETEVAPAETPEEAAAKLEGLATAGEAPTPTPGEGETSPVQDGETPPPQQPETPGQTAETTPPTQAGGNPATTYQHVTRQQTLPPATGQPTADAFVRGHPELRAGISILVNIIMRRWPLMMIKRTTGGVFPLESLHPRGQAADLAGPDEKYTWMAAEWVKDYLRAYLSQGFHGPSLSVSDSADVANSYWDQQSWTEHDGLMHLAVAGAQETKLIDDNQPTVRTIVELVAQPPPLRTPPQTLS